MLRLMLTSVLRGWHFNLLLIGTCAPCIIHAVANVIPSELGAVLYCRGVCDCYPLTQVQRSLLDKPLWYSFH